MCHSCSPVLNMTVCLNVMIYTFSTVIGCADLTSPSNDVTAPHWMTRDGDLAVFGCNGTSETWQLKCDGDQWIGTRRNCTLPLPAGE